MTALQPLKSIDSKNIFLLIQEILSNQKIKSKKHDKVLTLSIVDMLNEQYQKSLDEWAEKSAELKAKLSEEYSELKESLNSKGGWFLGGFSMVGAVLGLVGGPAGALVGALVGTSLAGGGILGDHLSKSNLFFNSERRIDPMKMKEKELQIIPISDKAQAIQVKANTMQGKISRTMQIEMESVQQLETAASNMIVSLLKLFGRTTDMMGRG